MASAYWVKSGKMQIKREKRRMNMELNFYMPTKVVMGRECIARNAGLFSQLGSRALIVTGVRSAKMNGSADDVIRALTEVGISYVIYDKVMSNPTIDCVYEGARLARIEGVDFVVAIGGGSPMDAAKAIALLAVQDISKEELFSGSYDNKVLPMAFVPTTAGTGSEVTQYAVLTNDKARTKTSIASPVIFPTVAFLDAKYMKSLSMETIINTGIDALSHAVEGMLSVKATVMTNILAAESIRRIVAVFPSMKGQMLSDEECESLLYASMLAGMVIAHTGTTAVHSMGYSLTYFKEIDHGRANGLLLGAFLKFVQRNNGKVVKELLELMNMKQIDEFNVLMDELLGEKEKFTKEELLEYARIAIKAKNIPNCVVIPEYEDLVEVYSKSLM